VTGTFPGTEVFLRMILLAIAFLNKGDHLIIGVRTPKNLRE